MSITNLLSLSEIATIIITFIIVTYLLSPSSTAESTTFIWRPGVTTASQAKRFIYSSVTSKLLTLSRLVLSLILK